MPASLLQIAEELETKLAPIVSASDFDVQLAHFRVLQPTPPCLDIYPADPFTGNLAAGFADNAETVWTVRARIGAADSDAAQEFLLRLMDTEDDLSVVTALQDDQTLNGKAGSVYVEGPSGHRIYEEALHSASWLGIEWRVTVIRSDVTS